ncbi:bacitracin ABC transporter permease [Bacillus altitudinis]|uniref:bacitracin ABC transporter permease n=1 Tax=Bacillus altitudinis TaxID=293387 RepID=UPI000969B5E4|nr:bacitracin ABC transporter permease [Bacillus altitudinis]SIT94127.1 hypothetical protein SAMN05216491_3198 [Bacillus altitudinis]
MIHFMKGELRKGHMKQYIQASFIASIVLLVFIYFIAFAAKIEREPGFQQYTNIYLLTSTVWMIFFSIITAMLYWRVGKTVYQERTSNSVRFLSHMIWMVCLSTFAMMCSIIPSFVVFSVTELFFPIVHDTLTAGSLFQLMKTFFMLIVCVQAIGMMAMRIGLSKKSVLMTVLTAIVLCAVLGNVSLAIYGNDQMNLILSGVMIAAVLIVILELWSRIGRMQTR